MAELPATELFSETKELIHVRSKFRGKTIEEAFNFVVFGSFMTSTINLLNRMMINSLL